MDFRVEARERRGLVQAAAAIDLRDAAGVAPGTREGRAEPCVDRFAGAGGIEPGTGEDQHVRVVVFHGAAGGVEVVADRGADAAEAVRGDGHAGAGGADQHAAFAAAVGDALRDLHREVRIVVVGDARRDLHREVRIVVVGDEFMRADIIDGDAL